MPVSPEPADRESAVLHRDLTKSYRQFVGGDGVYLIDDTGRRYLDAAGGVAVNVVGHGERTITDAIAAHRRRSSPRPGRRSWPATSRA